MKSPLSAPRARWLSSVVALRPVALSAKKWRLLNFIRELLDGERD